MIKERVLTEALLRAEDGSADPDAVAAWAKALPDNNILCRDMGHTWRPYKARFVTEMNSYERTLRCPRCRAQRTQTLGLSGQILSSHYVYQEGYQSPHGSGRITGPGRAALRLVSIQRLIEE